MMSDPAQQSLVLVRHLRSHSETRHQHARAVHRGDEIRVGRGAYVPRAVWETLDERSRCGLRMMALARTRDAPIVFSHWSAAVWHGLPVVGPVPDPLHIAVGRTSGGRSAKGVRAHATVVDPTEVVEVDGLRVTSKERTIVDLAAVAPAAEAIAMADHVLREGASRRDPAARTARSRLLDAWERALPFRGHRRAAEVIAFAEPLAESPLESVSRVGIRAAGLPQPCLQVPYSDRRGAIGRVDFAWPEFGVVGEADGDSKYLDETLRGGRSAERVVLDEKVREDRLRALGLTVVRWRWDDARTRGALAAKLADAGLPVDFGVAWISAAGRGQSGD